MTRCLAHHSTFVSRPSSAQWLSNAPGTVLIKDAVLLGVSLVVPSPVSMESFITAECRKCQEKFVRFLSAWIPADEDFIAYYSQSVQTLMVDFDPSFSTAVELAQTESTAISRLREQGLIRPV